MKKVSKVLAVLALTCVWGGAALLSVSCANNSNSSNNGGSGGSEAPTLAMRRWTRQRKARPWR